MCQGRDSHKLNEPFVARGQLCVSTDGDGVIQPKHTPVIVATLEDLKKSRTSAQEKGRGMYANDLGDQINGMEKVLSELELPTEQRGKNGDGQ